MERVAGKLPMVLLAATTLALLGAVGAVGAGSAEARIAFTTCAHTNVLACGALKAPLSPSGAAPGAVRLAIRRRRAPVGESASAVIALAGGPGQAAIPFAETFAEVLGPIVSTRDLIVFDQRGTGLSGALKCKALAAQSNAPASRIVKRCAQQLGTSRAFYTTPETVADIEAIRVAGGYEKLVLYGTSYGTKVALEYAQEHPAHVEALILDSVVPPGGPEPFDLATFAAVPRVLWDLCAFHACRHITGNPVGDLRRLVAAMGRRPLRAAVFDGKGHRHIVHVNSAEMLDILIAGDLDPVLRAEFPAAIAAADSGDTALLGRLLIHALASEEEESEQGKDPAFDGPLYFATMCEEEPFPWSRSAGPRQRLAEVTRRLETVPPSAFAPFTRSDVLPLSDMPACAGWPFSRPAPPAVQGPLPNVPTLIVSGAEDLRTPTASARRVAAMIPDAHLLVVPDTGHSVLTTEPGSCAIDALHALFAGHAVRRCKRSAPPSYLQPTPLAPRSASKLSPLHSYSGTAGRTLHAVALTLDDLVRQLSITISEAGGLEAAAHSPLRSGGLRGGWAALSPRRVRIHGYSYVPGVSLSGWTGYEHLYLRVSGHAAASGSLTLSAHEELVGELGGQSIRISLRRLRKIAPSGESLAQVAGVRGPVAAGLASRLPKGGGGRGLEQLVAVNDGLGGTGSEPSTAALQYALLHAAARRGLR